MKRNSHLTRTFSGTTLSLAMSLGLLMTVGCYVEADEQRPGQDVEAQAIVEELASIEADYADVQSRAAQADEPGETEGAGCNSKWDNIRDTERLWIDHADVEALATDTRVVTIAAFDSESASTEALHMLAAHNAAAEIIMQDGPVLIAAVEVGMIEQLQTAGGLKRLETHEKRSDQETSDCSSWCWNLSNCGCTGCRSHCWYNCNILGVGICQDLMDQQGKPCCISSTSSCC